MYLHKCVGDVCFMEGSCMCVFERERSRESERERESEYCKTFKEIEISHDK